MVHENFNSKQRSKGILQVLTDSKKYGGLRKDHINNRYLTLANEFNYLMSLSFYFSINNLLEEKED